MCNNSSVRMSVCVCVWGRNHKPSGNIAFTHSHTHTHTHTPAKELPQSVEKTSTWFSTFYARFLFPGILAQATDYVTCQHCRHRDTERDSNISSSSSSVSQSETGSIAAVACQKCCKFSSTSCFSLVFPLHFLGQRASWQCASVCVCACVCVCVCLGVYV